MGGFDADGVAREFFPDGRHRVLLVVNIGHPSDSAFRPRLPRLGYDDVVTTL
jgi:3-hydroxypropanoate dehydrogenase